MPHVGVNGEKTAENSNREKERERRHPPEAQQFPDATWNSRNTSTFLRGSGGDSQISRIVNHPLHSGGRVCPYREEEDSPAGISARGESHFKPKIPLARRPNTHLNHQAL